MSSKVKSRKRAADYDSDDDGGSSSKRTKGTADGPKKDVDDGEYWEVGCP